MLNESASGLATLATLERRLTGSVPDDSAVPRTIRRGVRLMLLGGALTALVAVFLIIATVADKSALTDANGNKLSSGAFASSIAATAVVYLLLVAVWVLMARVNRAGHQWARILASVFALISSYDTYSLVSSLKGGQTLTVVDIVYIFFSIAIWIAGVLSVAMIWRSESSAYYRSRASAR